MKEKEKEDGHDIVTDVVTVDQHQQQRPQLLQQQQQYDNDTPQAPPAQQPPSPSLLQRPQEMPKDQDGPDRVSDVVIEQQQQQQPLEVQQQSQQHDTDAPQPAQPDDIAADVVMMEQQVQQQFQQLLQQDDKDVPQAAPPPTLPPSQQQQEQPLLQPASAVQQRQEQPMLEPNAPSSSSEQDGDDSHKEPEKQMDRTSVRPSWLVKSKVQNVSFSHDQLLQMGSDDPDDAEGTTTRKSQIGHHRRSTKLQDSKNSLSLRRLPIDALLNPSTRKIGDDDTEEDEDGARSKHPDISASTADPVGVAAATNTMTRGTTATISPTRMSTTTTLQTLGCLSTKFSLKTQLMLTFGSIIIVTILFALVTCNVVSYLVGNTVKQISNEAFETKLIDDIQTTTLHYLAETLEQQYMPIELMTILEEATQDRFQGYPYTIDNVDNIPNDDVGIADVDHDDELKVPFKDSITGQYIYPINLQSNELPLNWQIPSDITEENYIQHVQQIRWEALYHRKETVSTATGVFRMQGACDPNEINEESVHYLPNCTAENNNVRTGGVIRPSNHTYYLYQKSKDLVPVLKAIFDAQPVVLELGIYFKNQGSGCTTGFPAYPVNTFLNYESVGCDWMKLSNPIDPSLGPIGTREEIQNCRPAGQRIRNYNYNPMERLWCMKQVQKPNRVSIESFPDAWNGIWTLSLGKPVYDRITKQFIACTWLSISLPDAKETLENSVIENSVLSIVRHDPDGTVIVSTGTPDDNTATTTTTSSVHDDVDNVNQTDKSHQDVDYDFTIDQYNVGMSKESYQEVYKLVNWDQEWDPVVVQKQYDDFRSQQNGYIVAVEPIPRIPDTYDPDYSPVLLLVMSSSEEDVFQGLDGLSDDVDDLVWVTARISILTGAIGAIVMVMIIFVMSYALTQPLKYINKAASSIVSRVGEEKKPTTKFPTISAFKLPSTHLTRTSRSSNNGAGEDEEVEEGRLLNIDQENQYFIKADQSGKILCAPNTELNDVLSEFSTLVTNFSGNSLLAKSEIERLMEVRNRFDLHTEFQELYESRRNETSSSSTFDYNIDSSTVPSSSSFEGGSDDENGNHDMTKNKVFVNRGSNLMKSNASGGGTRTSIVATPNKSSSTQSILIEDGDDADHGKGHRKSRLFLWTVLLIVTPLLLTAIVTSAIVLSTMTTEFDKIIGRVESHYVHVTLEALSVHTGLRAELVSVAIGDRARDLYMLTRYLSWIVFGGITRSNTFTEYVPSPLETCKVHPDGYTECPEAQANYICNCNWGDKFAPTCQDYSNTKDPSSRRLQKLFFTAEKSVDTLPDGDRRNASKPPMSAQETKWWTDVSQVPGREKGSSVSGHDTLYDRLRVMSAMPMFQAIYNGKSKRQHGFISAVGMEADGLFVGYEGCDNYFSSGTMEWQSTKENGAAQIRPELCPLGKFGYDPRCREWYHTGRKLATENNTSLYITSSYPFAGSNLIGQTATSPLVDPRTGEHVGQVLNDFDLSDVIEALSQPKTLGEHGFALLVKTQGDTNQNVVISKEGGVEIGDVSKIILPSDHDGCNNNKNNNTEGCQKDEHLASFELIIDSMKRGETRETEFRRTTSEGQIQVVHMSYAPVNVTSLRPINSADFAGGVDVSVLPIYSLGLCTTSEDTVKPFRKIEKEMNRPIRAAVIVLLLGISIASLFVILVSYRIAKSITGPMRNLLELIRRINNSEFDLDPPKIEQAAGPKEIQKVSDTVGILYKVVRTANEYYYAGELHAAYNIMGDSLIVFKKLDNKKAVAVANNNLGNILFAIYNEMKEMNLQEHCGLARRDVIAMGIGHFHKAIQLGEAAYDEFYASEGWTPNCLDFMQHLSNRYFNRALFLLNIKDEHEEPAKIEELGLRDLTIARDMDYEIIEYGEDVGFNRESRAHKLFPVHIMRARGHNALMEAGYPSDSNKIARSCSYPDQWDLLEHLDDCFSLLQTEYKRSKTESPKLFRAINAVGRMQEIETELMKYKMLTKDYDDAAKIAIRLLYEDSRVFAEAYTTALHVLINYVARTEMDRNILRTLRGYHTRYESEIETSMDEQHPSKLSNLSESLTTKVDKFGGSSLSLRQKSSVAHWVKKRVSGLVTMEDF